MLCIIPIQCHYKIIFHLNSDQATKKKEIQRQRNTVLSMEAEFNRAEISAIYQLSRAKFAIANFIPFTLDIASMACNRWTWDSIFFSFIFVIDLSIVHKLIVFRVVYILK